MRARLAVMVLALCAAAGGCAGGSDGALDQSPSSAAASTVAPSTVAALDDGCAHVVNASATASEGGWVIAATVRSADTGDDKYADLWQARTPDGDVVVERVLTHPHVDEQPFTRSAQPVPLADDITDLVVVAHDSVAGWCGNGFDLSLDQ